MSAVLDVRHAETEVRTLLNAWARAVRAGDLDAIMACYAPDLIAFDAIGELRFVGADAYRAHWNTCLQSCAQMLFEIHDLHVAASEDLAFGHYLTRCGPGPEGDQEHISWMRATFACRKSHGRWQIVHEHFSAPFDPQTNLALLKLRP